MDNRDIVNGLFQSISPQLGFQVSLGDRNLCSVKRKSTGEEFVIELPNNGKIVHLYAALGDVPFENREKFFEFILKLSLHGTATAQSIIGIDPRINKLIITRPIPIDGLTESVLFNAMNDFFAILPITKDKLSQFLQTQVDSTTEPLGESPLAPNLSLLHI